MEEDILQQDADEGFEEDMEDLEKDMEEKQKSGKKAKQPEQTGQPVEQQAGEKITETYEVFITHPRLGVVNTLTGEGIEGFDIEKDQPIVQLCKLILNKLDKIATACGA